METTALRTGFLASTAVPVSQRSSTQIHPIAAKPKRRRRHLDRESGQAIEILGHAIQYLADEFAVECASESMNTGTRAASGKHPRMEAIELLMSFNRQIYMNCPVVPTLTDRLRNFLSRH